MDVRWSFPLLHDLNQCSRHVLIFVSNLFQIRIVPSDLQGKDKRRLYPRVRFLFPTNKPRLPLDVQQLYSWHLLLKKLRLVTITEPKDFSQITDVSSDYPLSRWPLNNITSPYLPTVNREYLHRTVLLWAGLFESRLTSVLNVNWSTIFSCLKMFFTSHLVCSLRLLQLKTERQTM